MLTLTLFILLLTANLTWAQTVAIVGKIQDTETQEGIPFATIAIYDAGSDVPLTGITSDFDGDFILTDVSPGDYKFTVSFIGYHTYEMPLLEISGSSQEVDLGVITLTPSTMQLDAVEFTAMSQTAVTRLDRRTYQASDFETARGGNAADLLNRLPSVSVSPEGDVSIRGTTDFVVYLNGRPTQMEASVLLAQISANNIEKIDIITVPTAQFDAQGKGGIINITTKRSEMEGFSLSVNGQLGSAPWGNRTDAFTGYKLNDNNYGGGLNFTHANNGRVFYGGIYYNHKDVNSSRSGSARILNEAENSYRHMIADGMKPEWYQNVSLNLGFDTQLSQNSNLSLSYYFGSRLEGRKAMYLYDIFVGDVEGAPIDGVPANQQLIFNPNEGIREGTFNTFNLDYTLNVSESARLSFSGLYEHSVLTHSIDNPNIFYNPATDELEDHQLHYWQQDETPLDGIRLSLEYNMDFSPTHSLSLGFQPQFFSIHGNLQYDTLHVPTGVWGSYSELENEIDLTRAIYAGYIDHSGSFGRFNYKAGLRFEYTDQELTIDNPDYFTLFERETISRNELQQLDWFPSVHAMYHINDFDNITLAGSRRISRSPIKDMAPFLYRRHLEVYLVGDPNLKPEYINNLELSYNKTIGNQQFSLIGFYRAVDNAVFRVNTVFVEEWVLIRSFTNSGNTQSIGAELNANLELGSNIKLFLGGSLYDYRVQADIFGFREDHRGLTSSLKGSANWMVTPEIRFTADFDMRSAQITAQGRNEMRYLANAALSYHPRNLSNWGFSLRGLNLLNSNTRELSTRAYNASEVQIFYQDTEFYWYGPVVEMSITYNLNWNGQLRRTGSEFGEEEF